MEPKSIYTLKGSEAQRLFDLLQKTPHLFIPDAVNVCQAHDGIVALPVMIPGVGAFVKPLILVTNYEVAHDLLLNEEVGKGRSAEVMFLFSGGKGVVGEHGSEYRRQSAGLRKLFNSATATGYAPQMAYVLDRWLSSLTLGNSIDIRHDLTQVNLEVLLRTAFGMNQIDPNQLSELPGVFEEMVAASRSLVFEPAFRIQALFNAKKRRLLNSMPKNEAIIDAFVQPIVDKRRQAPANSVLRAMVDSGLSPHDIAVNAKQLIFAGNDTISNTGVFVLNSLSQQTTYHQKRFFEQVSISQSLRDFKHTEAWSFVNMVMAEKAPPQMLPRFVAGDFASAEYTIPAKSDILLLPKGIMDNASAYYATHHNEVAERSGAGKFDQFGGGVHRCIGWPYAEEVLFQLLKALAKHRVMFMPLGKLTVHMEPGILTPSGPGLKVQVLAM